MEAILSLMTCNARAGAGTSMKKEGLKMFITLAVVLFVIWIIAFLFLHVTSFLIHLLIIFAVISLIVHFVTGRRAA